MTEPTMSPMLYLIRHGETAWSLSGQHTGRTDLALTAHGEDQARALAPALAGIAFAHVLTSPLQRARHTSVLAGLATAAVVEPDLIEWNYGDYEGVRTADIVAQRPGWSIYRDGCPSGEMPGDVASRADRLIAKLGALTGNIALFSHGQFGCSLAVRWIGLAIAEGRHLTLDTASLGMLATGKGHPDTRTIAMWNFVPGRFATA